MVSKYMKRCSISLVIREMQTKTSTRYHYILGKILKKEQQGHRMELSYDPGKNAQWCSHGGQQFASFSSG